MEPLGRPMKETTLTLGLIVRAEKMATLKGGLRHRQETQNSRCLSKAVISPMGLGTENLGEITHVRERDL